MKKTKGLAVIMLLLICFMAFVACDGGVSLIKSVTLTKLPTKVVYNIGEKFDPTGGQITAVMTKDDEVVVVDITADMCGEVDTTKAGKVDVKIGYLEKSVTFQITVVDPSVKTKSIEVTTKPTKVGYLIGEKFSAAGGKLTVTKTDDTKEIIDLTDAMCGTVSTATAGKVAVTVTYQEKSTTFEITVAAPTVSSIAVSANPTKVEYIAGVAFSAVGGKITVSYSNGDIKVIDMTDEMCGTVDTSKVGKVAVTVTYETKTATFDITVIAPAVSSIAVTTNPTKLSYFVGEVFSAVGGKITVTMTDTTTNVIDLTDAMCGTVSTATAGTVTVTVTYETKTATFDITVANKIAPTIFTEPTASGNVTYGDALPAITGEAKDDANSVAGAFTLDAGQTLTVANSTYNYTFAPTDTAKYATVTGTATITVVAKALTITGVTANDRAYDGTTVVALVPGTLNGVIGADDVSYTLSAGSIENANVGNAKAVTYTATLTGTTAGNYTVTVNDVTVNIAAKAVAVVWGSSELVVTGSEIAPTATVETGFASETITFTVAGNTAVGKYTATAVAVAGANTSLANYLIINLTFDYSIVNVSASTVAELTTAIANAKDGDTIEVVAGTYDIPTINVDKNIIINGANVDTTILNGSLNLKNGQVKNLTLTNVKNNDLLNIGNTTAATINMTNVKVLFPVFTATDNIAKNNRTVAFVIKNNIANITISGCQFVNNADNGTNTKEVNEWSYGLSMSEGNKGSVTIDSCAFDGAFRTMLPSLNGVVTITNNTFKNAVETVKNGPANGAGSGVTCITTVPGAATIKIDNNTFDNVGGFYFQTTVAFTANTVKVEKFDNFIQISNGTAVQLDLSTDTFVCGTNSVGFYGSEVNFTLPAGFTQYVGQEKIDKVWTNWNAIRRVSTAEALTTALANAKDGDTIQITGTLGNATPDGHTAYDINKAVTIQGMNGAIVYGAFNVKVDGVVIKDLIINVRGGGSAPLKNGINVVAKTVTITNNTINLTDRNLVANAQGVANGIVIWPFGSGVANYNITNNTINGFDVNTPDWISSGIVVAEVIDLTNLGKPGVNSTTMDYTEQQELALATANKYTNCTTNYARQNWSISGDHIFTLAGKELQNTGVVYIPAGTYTLDTTLIIKQADTRLIGLGEVILQAKAGFVGDLITVTGANVTFDNVTIVANTANTLTAALASAVDGNTISLAAGNFATDLTITKSIKFVGAGVASTTITGAIIVSGVDKTVSFEGIKIHRETTNTKGIITITSNATVNVKDCVIEHKDKDGGHVTSTTGVRMEGANAKLYLVNTIIDVAYYGIGMRNVGQVVDIQGGKITGWAAIMTSASDLTSEPAVIVNNKITANGTTLVGRPLDKSDIYGIVVLQEGLHGNAVTLTNCTFDLIDNYGGGTDMGAIYAVFDIRSSNNTIKTTGCTLLNPIKYAVSIGRPDNGFAAKELPSNEFVANSFDINMTLPASYAINISIVGMGVNKNQHRELNYSPVVKINNQNYYIAENSAQLATAAAKVVANDTIILGVGVFADPVVISAPITLIGQGATKTTVTTCTINSGAVVKDVTITNRTNQ